MKADVYTRIADKIVSDLEQSVRAWFKPWNAENAAGRITRPLRHNGQPYNGINVLMLWTAAMERGGRIMPRFEVRKEPYFHRKISA